MCWSDVTVALSESESTSELTGISPFISFDELLPAFGRDICVCGDEVFNSRVLTMRPWLLCAGSGEHIQHVH